MEEGRKTKERERKKEEKYRGESRQQVRKTSVCLRNNACCRQITHKKMLCCGIENKKVTVV